MNINDFFDLYIDYIKDNTESPITYHRWSIIGCAASALVRRVEIPMGHFTLYPNFYIQLIGPPGTRKSSAISIASKILKESGFKNFSADTTTREGFLKRLTEVHDSTLDMSQINIGDEDTKVDYTKLFDLEDSKISHLMVAADEFTDFIGENHSHFLKMLSKMWDCPQQYENELKTEKIKKIYKPTITILSATTPSGFQGIFEGRSLGQGILTRFILSYWNEPRGHIPFPESPDLKKQEKIIDIFRGLQKIKGRVTRTDEATAMLADIYKNWEIETPVFMEAYANRRFIHLLKLCAIFAAIEGKELEVNLNIVLTANTVLALAEDGMFKTFKTIFQNAKDTELQDNISTLLEGQEVPIGFDAIYSNLRHLCNSPKVLHAVLENMHMRMDIIKSKTGGYLIRKAVRSRSNEKFLNLDILTKDEREFYET